MPRIPVMAPGDGFGVDNVAAATTSRHDAQPQCSGRPVSAASSTQKVQSTPSGLTILGSGRLASISMPRASRVNSSSASAYRRLPNTRLSFNKPADAKN